MTSTTDAPTPPGTEQIEPDPQLTIDFLARRVAALSLELAQTQAGMQMQYQRAVIAEKVLAEQGATQAL